MNIEQLKKFHFSAAFRKEQEKGQTYCWYLLYASGSIVVAKCTTWTAHAIFHAIVEQCTGAGVSIDFSGAAQIARRGPRTACDCPSATNGTQCRFCGGSGSPDGTIVAGDGAFFVRILPRRTIVTFSLGRAAVGVAARGAARTGKH